MKFSDIKKAQQILEQLEKHIKVFLEKLIQEECNFLNDPRNKGILVAGWKSPTLFCTYHSNNGRSRNLSEVETKKVVKPTDFNITEVRETVVEIKTPKAILRIPLEYNDQSFVLFCEDYFKPMIKEVNDMESAQLQKTIEQQKEKQDKDTLLSVHKDGKYSYQWKQCKKCNGEGTMEVGTGKFRPFRVGYDGAWMSERDPPDIEYTKTVDCPDCHGKGGLIEYRVSGEYGFITKPCSLRVFKENQNDFISILVK